MAHQIQSGKPDEDFSPNAAERTMAGIVHDLTDELAVICAYANLGGISNDPARTESYFALIESAGKKASLLTRQLPRPDLPAFC